MVVTLMFSAINVENVAQYFTGNQTVFLLIYRLVSTQYFYFYI